MLSTLAERLTAAVHSVTGRGRISEENVRETVRQIRIALLEADVALPVAKQFVEQVRDRALGHEVARSLNPGQAFTKIVHDELVRVLGTEKAALSAKGQPAVVMLVGLQGAGKTTTAGKLANLLARRNRGKTMLASTDVYRPAAREQLEKLADMVGADWYASDSSEAESIASAALREARRRGCDWLIVDTAGRLHVDESLMREMQNVHDILDPSETLFVIDSMAGQDAVNAARSFNSAVPLTGVVLTKTDGDARGGAALSVREVTGVPIKFVGSGEKLDTLEEFDPYRFAGRILGMGDVVGLVEQVQERIDQREMERVAGKMRQGRALNLEDFRGQLEQMLQMGGFAAIVDKLPGLPAVAPAQLDDRQIRRQMAIIDSMTRVERRKPILIDGSRKRRIAAGCGLPVQDVNRLLKQHKQLVKTMKKVSRGGIHGLLRGVLAGRPPQRRR